uniref:small monomeric GTPase n=1 Tax=Cacopsylla melanoneura TaxID=428564 RepID=A0A8D8W2L9_9HEMI
MTSNAIRGLRRKKSGLSEVKVAVIGAPGVGKRALIVRFLTRRYIGEYDHQSDSRYKGEVLVDGDTVLFEILDTCPKSIEELPSRDTIHWADGILLVYAITDRESFTMYDESGLNSPINRAVSTIIMWSYLKFRMKSLPLLGFEPAPWITRLTTGLQRQIILCKIITKYK